MTEAAKPPAQLVRIDSSNAQGEAVSVIHPDTGEILELKDATDQQLAEWILAVRSWEANARTAKAFVSREAHRRMDADAKWSRPLAGGMTLRGESPEVVEYDADALRAELLALIKEGKISADAAKDALKREVVYTPSKRGINALLKLGGDVKARVKACASPKERRSLKVEGGER